MDRLLDVTVGPDGTGPLVRLAGELDYGSAEALRARLLPIVDTPDSTVTLQLQDLRFCDAAGVDVLVELRAAAQNAGTRLVLRDAPPWLQRLLRTAEVDHLLDDGEEPEVADEDAVAL